MRQPFVAPFETTFMNTLPVGAVPDPVLVGAGAVVVGEEAVVVDADDFGSHLMPVAGQEDVETGPAGVNVPEVIVPDVVNPNQTSRIVSVKLSFERLSRQRQTFRSSRDSPSLSAPDEHCQTTS